MGSATSRLLAFSIQTLADAVTTGTLSVQPIFDTSLFLARKRRALANPVAGADFLMRRIGDDLADRINAVERRFTSAATLFCQTATARDVLAASGKVANVVRVEADPAFLAGQPGVIAPP